MYKVFKRIRDFICIFNSDRVITFCNQSFLKHLNYTTLIGVSLDDILLPNSAWTEKKCQTTGKHLLTFKDAQSQEAIVYTEDLLPLTYGKDHALLIMYPFADIFYTKKDLEQILDQLPLDIWLKDEHSQYIYLNQKFANWMIPNSRPINFLGQPEELYWDKHLSSYFKRTDSEVLSSGRSTIIPEVMRLDDTDVYWQTHKIPFAYAGEKFNTVLGTTYIPLNNSNLQISLAHATRQLNMLHEIIQTPLSHLDTQSSLQRVSSMITQALNVPALCILFYDKETHDFVVCTSNGLFEQCLPVQKRISVSQELLQDLLSLEQIFLFIDLKDKNNLKPYYKNLVEPFIDLNICCLNQYLIKDKEDLLGLINIGYTTPDQCSSPDSHFIETLCNQVHGLIKSASLLKKAQLEVQKREFIEKQAIQLEKAMAIESMKNEFFINISHELKTPINILLSTYNLLEYFYNHKLLRVDEQVDFLKYIGIMKQNAYRLLRLITNLIDITKIDSGEYPLQLGLHNIVHLIEETTLSITNYIESKNIELLFDTDIEECFILCDPEKIERIMLNLLSNAVKYVPAGGHITVYITHTTTHLQVSVKDTGIGIPADKLEFIFKRFSQVDTTLARPAEGSGIGLSLVHALIEMHQGHIWAQSELGKGSEFIFQLPIPHLDTLEDIISYHSSKENTSLSHDSIERCHIEFSDIYY